MMKVELLQLLPKGEPSIPPSELLADIVYIVTKRNDFSKKYYERKYKELEEIESFCASIRQILDVVTKKNK